MQQPIAYVTTSWDDGHRLDSRLADELAAHGIAGTFYVAPRCREFPEATRLSAGALRDVSQGFEIGAHTLTHPRLPSLQADQARQEIVEGKQALEDVIGRPVTSFCYPYGAYGEAHPAMVRAAGFSVARTVQRFDTTAPEDLFRMGTTTHAYRHLVDGSQIRRRAQTLRQSLRMWRNWDDLGRRLLDEVCAQGGVFHLWGHSWEIDDNDDWVRLRAMLAVIEDRDVVHVTNGQLAASLRGAA
jgi:peptidoglycan/xylan/chitin deacetylase (PgdA/CDA1 family)